MSKKPGKKGKSAKKKPLLSWIGGVVLFLVYAAVYPKIAERFEYLISDSITKRR